MTTSDVNELLHRYLDDAADHSILAILADFAEDSVAVGAFSHVDDTVRALFCCVHVATRLLLRALDHFQLGLQADQAHQDQGRAKEVEPRQDENNKEVEPRQVGTIRQGRTFHHSSASEDHGR